MVRGRQARWAPTGALRRADEEGAVLPAAVGTEQPHMSGRSRRPRADFLPNAAKRMGAARLNCGFCESPPGSPPLGCVIVPSTFCFPSCVPVRSPEPKAFSVTRERGPRRARECHPVCDFPRDSARRFSRPKPFVPMRQSVSILFLHCLTSFTPLLRLFKEMVPYPRIRYAATPIFSGARHGFSREPLWAGSPRGARQH